jgi:DNA polymerase-3 subunit gamma/tau
MATALVDMRGTTSPRLVLELACARILLPGAASDEAALLTRLDRLERRMTATGVAEAPATAPPSPPPPDPAEAEPAPVETTIAAEPEAETVAEPDTAAQPETRAATSPPGALDLAGLRRLWDAVLDAVKQRSRTAHALMLSAQIESLEDTTLTLSFKTPTLASRFVNDVADFVTEALKEVVGVDLRLRTTSGGAGDSTSTAATKSPKAATTVVPDPEPDEIDVTGVEDGEGAVGGPQDPSDAALSLVKESLGGQVIGEIDQS